MKSILAITLILLIGHLQVLAAIPAQNKTEDEIKKTVTQALYKDRHVTVKHKSGRVIKGKVQSADIDSFTLQVVNSAGLETFKYSEVASIKIHSAFGRVFGTIVGGPAYATGGWKGVAIISALFGGLIAIVASQRD